MGIVLSAKYFVCTAASAVKLQKKIAKEVFPRKSKADKPKAQKKSSSRPEAEVSSTQSLYLTAMAARLTSTILKGSSTATTSGGSKGKKAQEKQRGEIPSNAEDLAKIMNFKYVVLDEAGAMLEPDMVRYGSHNNKVGSDASLLLSEVHWSKVKKVVNNEAHSEFLRISYRTLVVVLLGVSIIQVLPLDSSMFGIWEMLCR